MLNSNNLEYFYVWRIEKDRITNLYDDARQECLGYIDEDVGKDDTASRGEEQSPYKTLLHALIHHPPGIVSQYLMRRSETGPVSEENTPAARLEWKPATKSALKKATNLFEQHQRRLARGDSVAIRERKRQRRERLLLKRQRRLR